MADKSIAELPVSPGLDDEALLPVYQNGQTQSIKGQQIRAFAEAALGDSVSRAETAANEAKTAAKTATDSVAQIGDSVEQTQQNAQAAQEARQAIENMRVEAQTLENGEPATVEKSVVEGVVKLLFGLPRGEQGVQGNPGNSIEKIERTAGTGTSGSTDTYTVTLTDGSTTTFQVYNGKDGTGAGDMTSSVYDPTGKAADIFGYVDNAVSGIEAGVTSFNGRTGAIMPQIGDYTAEMVGAATMEQVNTAIQTAILDSWEASY